MKTLVYIIFLFVQSLSIHAQAIKYPVGLPSPGLLAYGNKPSDISFLANIASLVNYEKPELSVVGERRFLMEELQLFSAAGACKLMGGWTAVALHYHGFETFKSIDAGVAYARSLGRLSLGLKFNYSSSSVAGYNGTSFLYAQTGMLVRLTPRLKFGWQVENFPSSISKYAGKPRVLYKAGLGYMASPDLLIGTELTKEEDLPLNIHAGFSYTYRRRFFIRAGSQSATGSFYAGAGWAMKELQLHLSVSHHPYLGFSPALLLNQKF